MIGYFDKDAVLLDCSRSNENNGSGNTFNIEGRINSQSMCDLSFDNFFLWPMDPKQPSQMEGAISSYGLKLKGTDRDIRDGIKYPGEVVVMQKIGYGVVLAHQIYFSQTLLSEAFTLMLP